MQSQKCSRSTFSSPDQVALSKPLSVISPLLDNLIDHPINFLKDQQIFFDISYSESPVLWIVEVRSEKLLWSVWDDVWYLRPQIDCYFFALLPRIHFHFSIFLFSSGWVLLYLHHVGWIKCNWKWFGGWRPDIPILQKESSKIPDIKYIWEFDTIELKGDKYKGSDWCYVVFMK